MWYCLPIFCLKFHAYFVMWQQIKPVQTEFLACDSLVIILCNWQSCQQCTMHAILAELHLMWIIFTNGIEKFITFESCEKDLYQIWQTDLVTQGKGDDLFWKRTYNSFSLCGTICYRQYAFKVVYILNARTITTTVSYEITYSFFFLSPECVLYLIMGLAHPTSSSSKSGNQHHGELLSKKENLLTSVEQIFCKSVLNVKTVIHYQCL